MLLFIIIVILPMLIFIASVALVLMWFNRILEVLNKIADGQRHWHEHQHDELYYNVHDKE